MTEGENLSPEWRECWKRVTTPDREPSQREVFMTSTARPTEKKKNQLGSTARRGPDEEPRARTCSVQISSYANEMEAEGEE